MRLNRKLLKEYNKAGKSVVRSKVLLDFGFDPNFFTHYWKNQKGEVYLFVYEYGFFEKNGERKGKIRVGHLAGVYGQKFKMKIETSY